MIEIFWPGEIRQLIANYRAQGILNEEGYNYITYLNKVFVWILGGLAIFYTLNSEIMLAAIHLAAIPLALWLDTKRIFNKQMAPYVYGQPAKLKVKDAFQKWVNRQVFICENVLEPRQDVIVYLGSKPRLKSEDIFAVGQIIDVYQFKRQAMPDIDYIKAKFSLTTQIL